jgi:hypothetical protein
MASSQIKLEHNDIELASKLRLRIRPGYRISAISAGVLLITAVGSAFACVFDTDCKMGSAREAPIALHALVAFAGLNRSKNSDFRAIDAQCRSKFDCVLHDVDLVFERWKDKSVAAATCLIRFALCDIFSRRIVKPSSIPHSLYVIHSRGELRAPTTMASNRNRAPRRCGMPSAGHRVMDQSAIQSRLLAAQTDGPLRRRENLWIEAGKTFELCSSLNLLRQPKVAAKPQPPKRSPNAPLTGVRYSHSARVNLLAATGDRDRFSQFRQFTSADVERVTHSHRRVCPILCLCRNCPPTELKTARQ